MDKQAIAVFGLLIAGFLAYQFLWIYPQQRRQAEWDAKHPDYFEQQGDGDPDGDVAPDGDGTPGPEASPDTSPVTTAGQPVEAPAEGDDPAAADGPEADAGPGDAPAETFTFETPAHEIVLSTAGASVERVGFKGVYHSTYKPVATSAEDEADPGRYEPLRPFDDDVRSFALRLLEGEGDARVAERTWAHEALAGGAHRFTLDLPERGLRLVKTYRPPEREAEADADADADAEEDDSDREPVPLYHFDLEVEVVNTSDGPVELGYEMSGPAGMDNQMFGYRSLGLQTLAGWRQGDEVVYDYESSDDLQDPEEPSWTVGPKDVTYFGLGTHYFASLVLPGAETPVSVTEAQGLLRAKGVRPTELQLDDEDPSGIGHQALVVGRVEARTIAPGESLSDSYRVFVGPRQSSLFERAGSPYAGYGLEKMVDLGWFESISRVLLAVLFGLHAIVGNWGVAIICLTFIVRGLLLPLSVWSQKNMLRMQKIAPEINTLKEKYAKKDGSMTPEQQREFTAAQMELFRKHGVNPVGCLGPLFLQFPIFIGLYNALNYSYELRQTPFAFWIQDLSSPDVLFRMPFTIPFLGTNAFSVLPLLMVGTYLLQQKLQPTPADPKAAEQQKMMKMIVPFFGFILYTVPSGLMLYFITSSLWSMTEMKTVKKWIEKAEGGAVQQPASAKA